MGGERGGEKGGEQGVEKSGEFFGIQQTNLPNVTIALHVERQRKTSKQTFVEVPMRVAFIMCDIRLPGRAHRPHPAQQPKQPHQAHHAHPHLAQSAPIQPKPRP